MRVIKSAATRTVELELNAGELEDLHKAREHFRSIYADTTFKAEERKAYEDAIYLISTVLGNHE